MNEPHRKTITSLILAVPCALLGIGVEARANVIDHPNQPNQPISRLDSSAEASDLNAPDLNASAIELSAPNSWGLAAAAAEVEPVGASELSILPQPTARFSDETQTPTQPVPSLDQLLKVAQTPRDNAPTLSDQEIRDQLLITPNPAAAPDLDVLDRRPQPVPSSTFITPNAYGADWGDFYIGTAGATENTQDGLDGSASVGMGFGNAVENVGVELNVGIISINGFAEDGTVGFKVHKLFPQANNLGVAVGWYNPIQWGAAKKDEDTFYGVVTQRFNLRPQKDNPMPLTTSLGIGTGTFRSNGAIAAGDNAPNLFGSIGLRVIPQVSLVSSWSGRALGLGASTAPFSNLPIVLTVGVSDLTDNTEAGTQFVGGLGYSFGF